MIVEHLELTDFRNYRSGSFDLRTGTTVVIGGNGQGKTNLAEAIGYLATLSSFRGAPADALVRAGADTAIIRARICDDDGRQSLVEAELSSSGRGRVLVNRQRLPRVRDLLGTVRVTVFSPDDLRILKDGPSGRRRFLDDTLVALANKYDAMRLELDRVLRQRNTLLKQAAGRLTPDIESTLDVWDERLADVGERFGQARVTLTSRLSPHVVHAYETLAGDRTPLGIHYESQWQGSGLASALADSRSADVRRGLSTVGPHRDDVVFEINGLPARTHASQGEQRTLALALRLAAHRLVTERTGSAPVLVLDDVLSELDDRRATALLGHLPTGQVVITTTHALPGVIDPDQILHVESGTVVTV